MQVQVYHSVAVKPEEIARLILEATPDEFAEIWLAVAKSLKTFTMPNQYDPKLKEWGEALGRSDGSVRLEIFELMVDTARHAWNEQKFSKAKKPT